MDVEAGTRDPVGLTRNVVFSPIRGSGLVEQTVRRLWEAIDFGLLQAGEQLPPEPDLAARLQVSLMTLREALASLREAGYLETRRGRSGGTFVRAQPAGRLSQAQRMLPDLTVDEMRDLLDFRQTIASGTVALACHRVTQEDATLLATLMDQMQETSSYDAWRRLDSRFHITIAAAAKSPRHVAAESSIQVELGNALGLNARSREVLRVIDKQHTEILAAILAGDESAAVAAMQVHVGNTADFLLGLAMSRDSKPAHRRRASATIGPR